MDVSSRLRICIRNWHLRDEQPLSGGFGSTVFACTTAGGAEAVLKLPRTVQETAAEASALAAWEPASAAVRLLAADLTSGGLLLERVRPGTQLPGGFDPAASRIAADLLARLHQASAGSFPFPGLQRVYMLAEQRAREDAVHERRVSANRTLGEAGLVRIDRARRTMESLCASTQQAALLHGDFLDKNILASGDSYRVIDPIPCIGDPCSDAGFFAAGHQPAAGTLDRANAIAAAMGLDNYRVQQWTAIWIVLQTCQAWRPDQSELDDLLATNEFEKLLDATPPVTSSGVVCEDGSA